MGLDGRSHAAGLDASDMFFLGSADWSSSQILQLGSPILDYLAGAQLGPEQAVGNAWAHSALAHNLGQARFSPSQLAGLGSTDLWYLGSAAWSSSQVAGLG